MVREWAYGSMFYCRQGRVYGRDLTLLNDLLHCNRAGEVWVTRHVDARIVARLLRYGLIDVAPDGDMKITLAGIAALDEVVANMRPVGIICPRCNERPRHVSGGRRLAMCFECRRKELQESRERRQDVLKDKPCAKCKRHPRAVSASGYQYSYCRKCASKVGTKSNRKHLRSIRTRLERGETVLCSSCYERPVHVTARAVYSLCAECRQEQQRKYYLTRKSKLLRQRLEKGASMIIRTITRKRGTDAAD